MGAYTLDQTNTTNRIGWRPALVWAGFVLAGCLLSPSIAFPCPAHARSILPRPFTPRPVTRKFSFFTKASKRFLARGHRPKQLLDIRYKTGRNYSRVVVLVSGLLSGVAEGDAPAKPGQSLPFRVFVDLTPCVPLPYWTRRAFVIGDSTIHRIRVGRNTLRTTRVVLELRRKVRYRVTMLKSPTRIVIDVGQLLPPVPNRRMRMPLNSPRRPTRRKVMPGRNWQPKRSRGSWRHKKGQPWVIRTPDPTRLPFRFPVRRIAIDAGHGGREDGAVGRRSRLTEKTVTLDISKRLVRMINSRIRGVRAFLVRRRDRTMSLYARVNRIKQGRADMLLSVHINSNMSRRVEGISTYILHWSERFNVARMLSSNPLLARENQGVNPLKFRSGVNALLNSMQLRTDLIMSRYLAILVQNALIRRTRRKYKTRNLGVRRGLFYLLFAAGVPAILVEASFLSNRKEERRLRTSTYRRQLAQGMFDGIAKIVKLSRKSLKRRIHQKLPRKRRR